MLKLGCGVMATLKLKLTQKHVEYNVQFILEWWSSCLFNTHKYKWPNNYSCTGWDEVNFLVFEKINFFICSYCSIFVVGWFPINTKENRLCEEHASPVCLQMAQWFQRRRIFLVGSYALWLIDWLISA